MDFDGKQLLFTSVYVKGTPRQVAIACGHDVRMGLTLMYESNPSCGLLGLSKDRKGNNQRKDDPADLTQQLNRRMFIPVAINRCKIEVNASNILLHLFDGRLIDLCPR
jgi:hypothetical protein